MREKGRCSSGESTSVLLGDQASLPSNRGGSGHASPRLRCREPGPERPQPLPAGSSGRRVLGEATPGEQAVPGRQGAQEPRPRPSGYTAANQSLVPAHQHTAANQSPAPAHQDTPQPIRALSTS